MIGVGIPAFGYQTQHAEDKPLSHPAHEERDAEHHGGIKKGYNSAVVFEAENAENPVNYIHHHAGDGI